MGFYFEPFKNGVFKFRNGVLKNKNKGMKIPEE